MVTLIASCIHFYAMGYMHDELHDIEDHEVTRADGTHLKRPGRFHRFFQYLSLFCFSMLGIVLAGNIAMVFVFWELVGICSYFLIGFYVERESASTAANKAFIVNRVGDFGMIIGLMALWTCFGTFAFGDKYEVDDKGQVVLNESGEKVVAEQGLFSLIDRQDHKIVIPDGVVRFSAREQVGEIVQGLGPQATSQEIETAIAAKIPEWREAGFGYWLLIVAGVGIFCGCVGKSAQWPLHVWLPDAMEGPTPVSALVHSATMVAAGVYLVGRFFPVFVPEVLLVIATTGAITLFMAATIAITATDIKRVLAYSTVSQLGYMMLALGLGGWVAGLMHLITHAFFKSLLFMGSGSVIHSVHTNDMTEMGGLRKKMPITAYTMLIGCLAIAGASIPFVVGLSGYYSKDAILEQAYSFKEVNTNSFLAQVFFWAAAGGAAVTAFYMFRLWYMTFAGKPRDQDRYDHAHESPRTMTVPLMVTAFFAITVAWSMFQPPVAWDVASDKNKSFPVWRVSLANLLEQARPNHTLAAIDARDGMTWPNEHDSHVAEIKTPVTLMAFFTAVGGIALATVMYCFGSVNPKDVKSQFKPVHTFLWNKWYWDELYEFIFIKPCHVVSSWISGVDRRLIDGLVDGLAAVTKWFAGAFEMVADQGIVDGSVNLFASWVYQAGLGLRRLQTGKLRHYVMFIVLGAIALFVIVSYLRIVA